MGNAMAKIEVLTAKVRVITMGNRQVTLSVYRQLDDVDHDEIIPFGRVRDNRDSDNYLHIIGSDNDGNLVKSSMACPDSHICIYYNGRIIKPFWPQYSFFQDNRDYEIKIDGIKYPIYIAYDYTGYRYKLVKEVPEILSLHIKGVSDNLDKAWLKYATLESLPLIVLAGLK